MNDADVHDPMTAVCGTVEDNVFVPLTKRNEYVDQLADACNASSARLAVPPFRGLKAKAAA